MTLTPRMAAIRNVLRWLATPLHVIALALALVPFAVLTTLVTLTNDNIPRADTAAYSQTLAIKAHTGTLTPADFLGRTARHPMITMDLTTVALATFTPWDLRVARYVLLAVALAAFLVLAVLGAGTLGRGAVWFLLPAALVFFTPANIFIYAMYDGISYFYPLFFSLAAFALVLLAPRHPATLGAACVLSVLSSLSFTTGLLAWGGVLLALVQRGYRHWGYYISLVGAALLTLYLTVAVLVSGTDLNPVGGSTAYTTENLRVWWWFIAIYLGRMFYWGSELTVPGTLGLVGVVLFAAMLVLAAVRYRDWRLVTAWGGIAGYALLTGFSISVSWNWNNGLYTALVSRYITFAALFWVAYIALLAYLLGRPATPVPVPWAERLVTTAAGGYGALLAVFFVFATVQLYDNNANTVKDANERCHIEYLFTRDLWRLGDEGCVFTAVDTLDALAEHRLALFAHLDPTTMPQLQQAPGLPVIVSTHDARINAQVQRWLLADLPGEQVVHLAPQPQADAETTLARYIPGDAPTLTADVMDFVGDAAAFWYIYRDGHAASDMDYHPVDLTPRFADGYIHIEETFTTWADVTFQVRLYLREPTPRAARQATFGDLFDLLAVTRVGALGACAPVTTLTTWELAVPTAPNLAYSASLFLIAPDGDVVARTDSQLGVLPTFAWAHGATYADARQLRIPCGLAPGDYQLAFRVYDYQNGRALPPTGDRAAGEHVVIAAFRVP